MADIKIKLLREGAKVPQRNHIGDAGWDLALPDPIPVGFVKSYGAAVVNLKSIMIPPHGRVLVPLGFSVALPPEEDGKIYELQFRPRSGSALKQGLTLANAVGTVDSNYRGECGVILLNTSADYITLQAGDRVAQAVLNVCQRQDYIEVDDLEETTRGEGGFGSTGVEG